MKKHILPFAASNGEHFAQVPSAALWLLRAVLKHRGANLVLRHFAPLHCEISPLPKLASQTHPTWGLDLVFEL